MSNIVKYHHNAVQFITLLNGGRLAKLQITKRAVRIITNSKYNAHTEPVFKDLYLLKIIDIFDVQCMKVWYKFSNNALSNYFRSMFQYNSS